MPQKRSLYQMIFGNKVQNTNKYQTIQFLNGQQAIWTNASSNLYDNVQIRACIDAIARNGAKLSPKHIRSYYDENGKYRTERVRDKIETLLSKKPNELMNAYQFYYKVISELELNNEVYVFISRDAQGNVLGLYPIKSGSYRLLEYGNNIYIQFQFSSGNRYTASIKDDVIHLSKFYSENDYLGADNNAILKVMSIKHVINEGIVNAIKTTQSIKGIVKSTKAMLKPEDVKQMRNQFVKDFIGDSDGSGIGGLDATTDFKEVNLNPQTATDGQVERIDNEYKNYYGVNDDILQNKFDENKWNAFYEGKIEPIAIQLSLEATNKIFSYGERWHGNEIIFEANRLQYASTNSKISVLKEAGALGILTRNEAREILNLSPVENGDEIIQSLNYTNLGSEGNDNE